MFTDYRPTGLLFAASSRHVQRSFLMSLWRLSFSRMTSSRWRTQRGLRHGTPLINKQYKIYNNNNSNRPTTTHYTGHHSYTKQYRYTTTRYTHTRYKACCHSLNCASLIHEAIQPATTHYRCCHGWFRGSVASHKVCNTKATFLHIKNSFNSSLISAFHTVSSTGHRWREIFLPSSIIPPHYIFIALFWIYVMFSFLLLSSRARYKKKHNC